MAVSHVAPRPVWPGVPPRLRVRLMFAVAACLLAPGCARGAGPATLATASATPDGLVTSRIPVAISDCGTAADPGNPDGGVVAGLNWPTGDRALKTPAQAYLCIGSYAGSLVTVQQAGSRLTIQPARFTVPDGGGVLPLTVIATTTGRTILWLRVASPAGKQQLVRPVALVVADGDRWHFERAG